MQWGRVFVLISFYFLIPADAKDRIAGVIIGAVAGLPGAFVSSILLFSKQR